MKLSDITIGQDVIWLSDDKKTVYSGRVARITEDITFSQDGRGYLTTHFIEVDSDLLGGTAALTSPQVFETTPYNTYILTMVAATNILLESLED